MQGSEPVADAKRAQRTIGLLAGMGVTSTAPFLELLIDECQRQYGATEEPDYPQMIIFSWPTPFRIGRPLDHDAMRNRVAEGLRWLEKTGVDFIAMPCNTAHIYFDTLQPVVSVPLLNMVDLAVDAIPGGAGSIAVLATRATRDADLYQQALGRRGFTVLAADETQTLIDRLLADLRKPHDRGALLARWDEIIHHVADLGADAALIACTDLNAVSSGRGSAVPLIDGTRALAARVVETWRQAEE